MKISIAMTTFNGEKFILKQLYSLLRQTRQPDEVVIFDDCSKDTTASITAAFIKRYSLSNWKLFVNVKNLGFIENFRLAIKKTSGDIIFLCDQDDIWERNKLEKMEKVFELSPEILTLFSAFKLIDSEDNSEKFHEKKDKSNHNLVNFPAAKNTLLRITPSEIAAGNVAPGCTIAFTSGLKKIYLENFNGELCHDYLINILSGINDGLFFLNTPLVRYRIHSGNTIGFSGGKGRRPRIERINESLVIIRMIRKYIPDFKKNRELLNMYRLHCARATVLLKPSGKNLVKLSAKAIAAKANYKLKRYFADLCYMLRLEKLF